MRILRIAVLFFVLMILSVFATPSALAGDVNLTFEWDQAVADINDPDFGGWYLYKSETPGVYNDPPFLNIVYGAQQPPYTSTQPITSPDDEKHTYYFVLTAYRTATDGERESAYSNEVSQVIDFQSPGIPFSLTVTVTPAP